MIGFSEAAVPMFRNGWKGLIPLMPGEKRPALKGWQAFNSRDQTIEELVATANITPAGYGLGMCSGNNVLAVDLDIPDEAAADRAVSIVESVLGASPLLRIGKPPKTMLFYRSEVPGLRRNPGNLAVELYPGGTPASGQIVMYGIHPGTGEPYDWPRQSPLDLSPTDLPTVDERGIEDLIATLAADPLIRSKGLVRHGQRLGNHGTSAVSLMAARAALRIRGYLPIWLRETRAGGRHAAATAACSVMMAMGLTEREEAVGLARLEDAFFAAKPEASDREWSDIVDWARLHHQPTHPLAELRRRLGLEIKS